MEKTSNFCHECRYDYRKIFPNLYKNENLPEFSYDSEYGESTYICPVCMVDGIISNLEFLSKNDEVNHIFKADFSKAISDLKFLSEMFKQIRGW